METFYIIFVLVTVFVKVFSIDVDFVERNASEIDNNLLENFVLYGIASERLSHFNGNISASCQKDLTQIFESINREELWALKALDASGTYRHSFVWGQNAWLGSKLECHYLNTPPKFSVSADIPKSMVSNLITTTSPIELEYRIIFSQIKSPYRIDCPSTYKYANVLRLGLCLPKSCSDHEIKIISQNYFTKRTMKFQRKYNVTLDIIHLRTMDIKNFFNRPEVIGIFWTLILMILLVVVFSVANDIVKSTKFIKLRKFLKCFSIRDNVAVMFKTSTSLNSIDSINGIRTLVCLWLIVCHTGYFGIFAFDNYPAYIGALDRIEMQPVLAVLLYVDGFFVLSGLLLTYNFLDDEQTLNEIRKSTFLANLKLFSKKIIHRYIRLTPPFLFLIGVGHILAIYIQESSSYHIDETFEVYCTKQQVWSSLLYVHNLFGINKMCMAWAWYLACDMQYYVITLIILFIYAKCTALAHGLFAVLFISLTAFVIFLNNKINLLPRLDSLIYNEDEYYIQPWHRMHPYLGGITIGYVMFQLKDKILPRHQCITITFWIYAAITLSTTVFLTYFKDATSLSFSLALTIGRYLLGLYIGSIISMCHFGYGGVVNKILSCKLFVHMNKTTYLIYLVHPMWIIYLNSSLNSSHHFEPSEIVVFGLGIMCLSYITAVILSPIIEIPFQKLSNEYFMGKVKKKQCSM